MKSFHKGNDTKLLLLSGMHGDEYGVIPHVSGCVSLYTDKLPDFIYIPEVSPSAVQLKTRKNTFGHDINRCFVDPVVDPEAQTICDQLRNLKQVISLDFHEDSSHTNDFYFYDTGEMSVQTLDAFRQVIFTCGVAVYNGIDDPEDPDLGCMVDHGYVSRGHEKDSHESGFLTKWMAHNGIISRAFTFEIPGNSENTVKEALVHAIFSFFLDRNFMIQ